MITGDFMRILSALAAAFVFATAVPTIAADAAVDEVVGNNTHDWSGVYVGVQGGYYWGSNSDVDVELCDTGPCQIVALIANSTISELRHTVNSDPGGFLGGGQVGYNFQSGSLLVGAEFDVQFGSGSSSGTVCISYLGCDEFNSTSTASSNLEWLGTARGRVGASVGRALCTPPEASLSEGCGTLSAWTHWERTWLQISKARLKGAG